MFLYPTTVIIYDFIAFYKHLKKTRPIFYNTHIIVYIFNNNEQNSIYIQQIIQVHNVMLIFNNIQKK